MSDRTAVPPDGHGAPFSRPGAPLPVEAALPRLEAALAGGGAAVLVAEPGAGKSTRVPTALRASALPGPGRLLVVQPRRVAADAVAARLAEASGAALGRRVGLRRRGRTVSGPDVDIEVVTDGVLLAMLGRDPTLEGVGGIILDEVHERGLTADVCLALVAHLRRELRPDLAVLAMSATVDSAAVAAVLGGAAVVEVPGRLHPVEVRHRRPDGSGLVGAITAAVAEALDAVDGDVLVFLPGAREIGAVSRELQRGPGAPGRGVEVRTLHGRASAAEQHAALRPSGRGSRAVILSTSLAQTSLTVPGVRAVVDSGLRRTARTDPHTGLPRLLTVPASRAAAAQRAGRAGRVAAGVAIRCWSPTEDANRPAFDDPEIVHADLAPVVLALSVAGIVDPGGLVWWTRPPDAAWAAARELLEGLGALDRGGRATALGAALAAQAMHPRLAAAAISVPGDPTGPAIAALLEDGLLPGDPVDLRTALDLALQPGPGPEHRTRAARVRAAAGDQVDRIRVADVGEFVARAFPERLAVREEQRPGAFRLAGGLVIELAPGGESLAGARVLAVAELDADRRGGRIHHGAPVDPDRLAAHWPERIRSETVAVVTGDGPAMTVEAVTRRVLELPAGPLTLAQVARRPDGTEAVEAVVEAVAAGGAERLGPLPEAMAELQARLTAVRSVDPSWPDVSGDALARSAREWLAPALPGPDGRRPLAGLDLTAALGAWAVGPRGRELERLAPTTATLASGRVVGLDWRRGAERGEHRPVLSVKVQDAFGTIRTPRVLGGARAVLVELLSPAQRPVAVTDDLERFWESGYAAVRSSLRGRYPRHAWPERPG